MLRQLDVMNRRGMTLIFDMFENDSGYQLQVDGLDPVKAEIVTTSYAGRDGVQFTSVSRGPRNLKIGIDLVPDGTEEKTYTKLRRKLYSYFMTKSQIRMRFHDTSGLYVDLYGVVEDVQAPMFEEDPDVNIVVLCTEPDFVDPRTVIREGVTVSGGTLTEIDYPGTVETGILFTMDVNRTVNDFTIYNTGEDGVQQQLDISSELLAGDKLIISTVPGSKSITRIRSGITTSLLRAKTPQSNWIEFAEGLNNFRVYAPGDPIPYELQYTVRYGSF